MHGCKAPAQVPFNYSVNSIGLAQTARASELPSILSTAGATRDGNVEEPEKSRFEGKPPRSTTHRERKPGLYRAIPAPPVNSRCRRANSSFRHAPQAQSPRATRAPDWESLLLACPCRFCLSLARVLQQTILLKLILKRASADPQDLRGLFTIMRQVRQRLTDDHHLHFRQ